jgi:hypothetical protein
MGSANRSPGSNLGRSTTDWEEAFAYYASLPPKDRCYQAVADQFGVSARTVEKHGRNGHWKQRLREIQAQTAAKTDAALGQARADHVGDLVKLIQASVISYAEQLRRGEVRISPRDLQGLHGLWQQLLNELSETQHAVTTEPPPPNASRSPEHTAEVIAALRETGALAALGLKPVSDGA